MHTDLHPLLLSLRTEPSGVPIYVQIREQVLRAIGTGTLAPGDRMPTMREVAVALRVDLNTVRRAYDALDRAGALRVVPARGTYVADRPAPHDAGAHDEAADAFARRTIALAHSHGLDPAAVAARMSQILKGDAP